MPQPDQLPELAPTELEIMKVLWRRGAASIREVHDDLSAEPERAYSTTKTLMDRMVRKGHLERRDFHGVFLYETRISKPLGLARLVRNFAERVLEVKAASVVPLFAESESLTPAELSELSKLLEGDEDAHR